jgi:hypothetical protein
MEQPEPPRQLALATLARIAERECTTLSLVPPPPRNNLAPWRGPRRSDLLAAAVLLILVGGLAVPWLLEKRHAYRILNCKNNMAQIWGAMELYSTRHEGKFPAIDEKGNHSFAGMYLPTLADDGLLNPGLRLACDSSADRSIKPITVSEMEGLWDQADHAAFQNRARQLAGNYAYNLGYRDKTDRILQAPCRANGKYPILADHCPNPTEWSNSPNHNGAGQNVLFTDGNVRWCTSPNVGRDGDNIYLNRENKVQAGVDFDDTVLGPGEASPGHGDK